MKLSKDETMCDQEKPVCNCLQEFYEKDYTCKECEKDSNNNYLKANYNGRECTSIDKCDFKDDDTKTQAEKDTYYQGGA